MIKMIPPIIYIKAHLFKSTVAAVSLAEKNTTPNNICFAKKLLEVKNSSENLRRDKTVIYNGMKMLRSEKYAHLLSRTNALSPALLAKDYTQNNNVGAEYDKINELTQFFQYTTAPNIQRYNDIGTAVCPPILTSNGTAMPANKIAINGQEIAMLCQYPTAEHMAEHCRMLLEQKPAVVVVLSSSNDIAEMKLPMYFGESRNYDGIQVNAALKINKKTRVKVDRQIGFFILNHYKMKINDGQKESMHSVIHVTNWPDKTSINARELNELTHYVQSKISDKCAEDNNLSEIPLIHCNAEVGRTGRLIGAMALADNANQHSVKILF